MRKWKTAVHAVADAGKGPVWTSSQLFTLEVAAAARDARRWSGRRSSRGKTTQLFCKVAVATPFDGQGEGDDLIGLPAKVTTQVIEITKDTKEIAFPIVADKTSPAGKHGGMFARW